jgi:hypothetical protein
VAGAGGDGHGDDVAPVHDAAPDPDPDAATSAKSGTIFIEQVTTPVALTIGIADFQNVISTNGSERTDGACVIRTGTSTQPPAVPAGDMTITRGTDVLVLDFDAQNGYAAFRVGPLHGG